MMRNITITLALCLCAGTLFAQTKANTTTTQRAFTGSETRYSYNSSADDLRRKNAAYIMDSIRNSPKWRSESAAFIAEFHNSAAWKKSQERSGQTLKILGDHPGPKEYGIWREAISSINAELEDSQAYKIYHAKSKDFNNRVDREVMKQLHKDDPRYKTAF
jgi:hypothetical protein